MKELKFKFGEYEILAIERGGKPWFVARNVCRALGIQYSGATLKPIPEKWKGMLKLNTNGGAQTVRIIAEPAIYRLAFRSHSAVAEEFTDWVVSDVLPSIRETGQFILDATIPPLEEHTKRPVQLENSRKVNGFNFRTGGLMKATEYNRENCIRHTGFRPSELKEFARMKGFKARERRSGKEVARQIMPEAACAMSLADVLTERGHSLEAATGVSRLTIGAFKGLLELGERPAELQGVN